MDYQYMVTVLLISYNHSKYIGKAIEGVFKQKISFPLQIIIHDDASTDDTQSIIRKQVSQYSGDANIVTILQKENQFSQGKSILFDHIRSKIQGKYYIVCECDDYWCDEYKLQKQVDYLENNSDFIGCTHNCKVVNEFEEEIDIHSLQLITCKQHIYKKVYFELASYFPGPTAAKIYRSEIWFKYPECFYNDYRSIQTQGDVKINFLLSLEGPIFYMGDSMSVYRRVESGGDSWSARQKGKNLNDRRFISSIQMRKFAKKYYHCNYFNYYITFNAGVRACLLWIKNPKKQENIDVMNRIIKEKSNIFIFLVYMFFLFFIALPLYFVRTSMRKKARI